MNNTNCNSCYSCYSCNSCNSCYSCNYSKNLKMSEYQIFCWSENYGDLMSKQQKDYRIFNKQVDATRYEAVLNQIKAIIPNPNKLNLPDFWKSLTNEQIIELSEIPEFDAQGFTYITGRDVPKKISLSGKKVVVIIDGQTFSATID